MVINYQQMLKSGIADSSCHQSWNWVTVSMGHLSRLGHRVVIVTRYET